LLAAFDNYGITGEESGNYGREGVVDRIVPGLKYIDVRIRLEGLTKYVPVQTYHDTIAHTTPNGS
jgi:hypothetical protein